VRGAPSIYGELTPEAEASYSRWIMALFDLTEHVSWCKAGCRDADYRCPVGRVLHAAEQSTWKLWKGARSG
jgi:hypothetical protein